MSINRKIVPSVNEITSFNIVKANSEKLSNGIELFIINTGEADLIKIEWMFAAGSWFQPAPLIAFTVNNTLIEGTSNLNSRQIAESVEFYGATLGYNVDKDNAYVSVFTQRKHLSNILEIISGIIRDAIFPEKEIDIFLQKHKQQFLIEQEKVGSIARNNHSRIMYGNSHPYGTQIILNDFDTITPELLKIFYKNHYSYRNCRIILSGRVAESDIKLVDQFFGTDHWGNSLVNNATRFQIEPESTQKVLVEKNDAVQNAIRIGRIVGNKLNPDYPGLNVLNCVLGGYFGSRLMKKIREEKGYTYGINSLLVTLVNSGYLTIVTEVGSDVTKPAIEDIYGEINKLRTELIPNEELNRVKNYLLGELIRMFDGPFAQAESLISLLEYNMDYTYYDTLIHEIRSISSEKILELAVKYLDSDLFSQVVAGCPF